MQIIKRTKPKIIPTIEPEEYNFRPLKKRLAVFDTETDPFAQGRIVKPFSCGFYIVDSEEYYDFWGDDCIKQYIDFMDANFSEEEFIICVHNGGNFDFYFLLEYFDRGMKPFIINGRLVRVFAHGQEYRDSYSMIPVALATYDKMEIDYSKFEREVREDNKEEILVYQKRDCTALGELVSSWYDMFGDKLTMASVALPTLNSYHGFESVTENIDDALRPYYFGGRCQAFELGELTPKSTKTFKIKDVNSMYPFAMKEMLHPISGTPRYEKSITDRTVFARITAWSNGALPIREKSGGLSFPVGTFQFHACIHEIKAGLETGNLRIHRIHETIYFDNMSNFGEFIDEHYRLRMEASANGDEIRKLFYKLVMNSSYGKFAQDPRKYENWIFDPVEIPMPQLCEPCFLRIKAGLKPDPDCSLCDRLTADGEREFSPYGWYLHSVTQGRHIYASAQKSHGGKGFYNVATAASITSAARAILLRGISMATRPVYCDTDSLICEELNLECDDKKLGAWKHEGEGDTVFIAGKKMYAVFNNNECIKKASKGVRLTGDEIASVALGNEIEYSNPVPKFQLDGSVDFVTRKIRATGNREVFIL